MLHTQLANGVPLLNDLKVVVMALRQLTAAKLSGKGFHQKTYYQQGLIQKGGNPGISPP